MKKVKKVKKVVCLCVEKGGGQTVSGVRVFQGTDYREPSSCLLSIRLVALCAAPSDLHACMLLCFPPLACFSTGRVFLIWLAARCVVVVV